MEVTNSEGMYTCGHGQTGGGPPGGVRARGALHTSRGHQPIPRRAGTGHGANGGADLPVGGERERGAEVVRHRVCARVVET